MTALSRRDVEHVAHLARLGLSDDEVSLFEEQLNHILEQFAALAQLDTSGIEPTARVIELADVMREDIVRSGLTVEEALANAPERAGDHIVVPAVLGDERTT